MERREEAGKMGGREGGREVIMEEMKKMRQEKAEFIRVKAETLCP